MHTIKTDSSDIAKELKEIGPTDLMWNREIAIRLNEVIDRLNRLDRMVYDLWEQRKVNLTGKHGDSVTQEQVNSR